MDYQNKFEFDEYEQHKSDEINKNKQKFLISDEQIK